jgi:hypothetical protein
MNDIFTEILNERYRKTDVFDRLMGIQSEYVGEVVMYASARFPQAQTKRPSVWKRLSNMLDRVLGAILPEGAI